MKHLVTQAHALEITALARGGWLSPFSRYDWVWRTHKGTYRTSVTITVLQDQLVYPMGVKRVQQAVRLTYTIGPRGGKRPWFVCPTCQRRVGVLYYVHPLPFRCRTCCELAYPSQYQSQNWSYGRQLRRLSRREQDRLLAPRAGGSDDFGHSVAKVETRLP
jgi:hypothetical protein